MKPEDDRLYQQLAAILNGAPNRYVRIRDLGVDPPAVFVTLTGSEAERLSSWLEARGA